MATSNTSSQSSSSTDAADKAKQQAESMKNDAQAQAQEAKRQAKDVANQAQQAAGDVANQAQAKAKELGQEAQSQAKSIARDQKNQAAEQASGVASALRESGQRFNEQDMGFVGQYAEQAADQVEQFSNYLSGSSVGDMLNDVEGYARRQPEVFVAGALAAGFLLGRFLKSTERRSSYGSSAPT